MPTKSVYHKQAARPRAIQPASDPFGRAIAYSIIIHIGIFLLATVYSYVHHSFAKPIRVDYSIQLEDIRAGSGSGSKRVAAKVQKPKEKPLPKPPEKKIEPPPEEKTVEVPKIEKAPPPKETPPPEQKAPEEKKPEPQPEEQKTEVKVAEQPAQKPVPKPEPPPPVDQFPDDFSITQKVGPGAAESEISGPENDGGSINPELRWYVELLRRKVRQNWIEPRYLLAPGSYARVVIRCEIGRDGTLASDPKVYESSTIPDFDQSGYRAVIRAAPFPPLPESLQRNVMGIRFSFEFGESA
jgi:TonB family protein